MNLFSLFFILHSLSNKSGFNNKKIVNCKDCVFYSKNKIKGVIEGVIEGENDLCKKYGEKDSFTGKIIFYEASKCREDVFRCGEYGTHFIQKEEKIEEK